MKNLILIALLPVILIGCGGGGGSSDSDDSSETASAGNTGSTGSSGSTGGSGSVSSNIATIGSCNVSAKQEELFNAHNEARGSARMCGSDSMPAVPPLEWHCLLQEAATLHSENMANIDFFSHTGADGLSPGDRMTNAGYKFRAAGENIAAGRSEVDGLMDGWLNSPGHCRNIMNSSYTQMGAGFGENSNSTYRIYSTVNFGTPR